MEDTCSCGTRFGEHSWPDKSVYIIRKNCVICGKDIPGTQSWYWARGNFCISCTAQAEYNVQMKVIEKTYSEITQETYHQFLCPCGFKEKFTIIKNHAYCPRCGKRKY